MSKCISRHGEYSEHEPDDDFLCATCGVLDEDALITDRKQLAEQLAAAQAVITGIQGFMDDVRLEGEYHDDHVWLDEANSRLDDIRGILEQSPTDALEAHDRQVAAKALTDAAYEWGEGTWQDVWAGDGVDDDVSAVQSTVRWLDARAAAIVSEPSTPEQEGKRG